ncbi:MAG TPA: DUF3352 domain-containing protein [Phycisphaerae bacterium]|nr:DUF3352 domain-containing protein [Phycisphaerae bacterium]
MNAFLRTAGCWTLLATVALAGEQPAAPAATPTDLLALAPADPLFVLYTEDVSALLDNPIALMAAREAGCPDAAALARGWRETFGGPTMLAVRAKALRPDALGISFAATVAGDANDLFSRLKAWTDGDLVGSQGAPPIEVGRDGQLITIRPSELPLAITLYVGVRDGLAYGDTWRQSVMEFLAGNNPNADGQRFVESEEFRRLPIAKNLRTWRGDLLAYLNLRPLITLARVQMDEESGRLFDAAGLDAFESVALTADWSGPALSANLAIGVADEQSGLTGLLVPPERKLEAASVLPADCVIACCGAMTNASDLADRLCEIIEKIDPDIVDEFRSELTEVTREFGFDPQHDFLDNMVDEWAIGVQAGDDEKPHLIAAVKLADADLFLRQFQNLVNGYGLPINTTVYRGVQIVSRGDDGDPPLALAVVDGYLVMGGSTQRVVSAIEAHLEHKAFDAHPNLKSILARLPDSASRLVFMNIARFAELALAEMGEEPERQDPLVVPVFSRAAGTDAALGIAVTSRPGTILVDLALNESGTQAAMEVVGQSMVESLAEARNQTRRTVSMANIKGIVTCCLIYASEHKGEFPTSLGDLVADGSMTVQMLRSPYDGSGPADVSEVDEQSFYLYRSGSNTKTMAQPATTVVLAEREVRNGRGAAVAFADGHVEWIEEPEAGRIIAELQAPAR